MDLYVLDNQFNTIAMIDDYTSLIWTKRYSDFGDCELYIKANAQMLDIVKRGYYLVRNDDDEMICRIESVEIDTDNEAGNYIIAIGYDCRKILSQRIVWDQTNVTGVTVEDLIRRLIDNAIVNPTNPERKIDNFVLGERQGFPAQISEQVTYKQLDEKIIELSKTYGYGTRLRFDGRLFIFEVYQGVDRSYNQASKDYVLFSPDFDNIISSKYLTDSSNFKNVALIGGEGEGKSRKTAEVGASTGLDRREIFVDAQSTSTDVEEGEVIDYTEALINEGIEALTEYGILTSFEGEVEPNYSYKYGTDYYLGDIVQVKNEYGMEASARITEIIESFDSDGYTVVPTFEYVEVASNGNTMRIL